MRLRLERRAYLPHCTIGVLTYGDERTLVTMERPWRENEAFVSCIPEGRYSCKRYHSKKFEDTWEVRGVPSREYILFHAGNSAADVQGCIALGTMLSEQEYKVLNSRVALKEFLRDTARESALDLTITHYAGVGL